MVLVATILFALAALGGLYLGYNHLQRRRPPLVIAVGHGALAITGLALILVQLLTTEFNPPMLIYSAGLFVLAALGGFLVFSFRLRQVEPPKLFVLAHGAVAVCGFICLVCAQL